MSLVLGIIIGICIPVCVAGIFYLGFRTGENSKPQPAEISEDQRLKLEKTNKEFQKLWKYDVDVAMGRRSDS